MIASFVNSPAAMALVAVPSEVVRSYFAFGLVFVTGVVAIFVSGDWQRARGLDKLILFGPIFYAAPLAAFGTEHFTRTPVIASIIPAWIPWHVAWAYFVGACFIAAAFSLVTGIQARLAASLVAFTFIMFEVLMIIPGWLRHPANRFALTIVLREISFAGGALAMAASLGAERHERRPHIMATIARYMVAVPVLFYSLEQFLHGDHVAGVPLEPLTPPYVLGHAIWTYLAAAVYAVAGVFLVAGRKTRAAAAWLGLTVLLVVIVEYVPIAVVELASIDNGLNYICDTLMFGGAVLMLARAMPRESGPQGEAR